MKFKEKLMKAKNWLTEQQKEYDEGLLRRYNRGYIESRNMNWFELHRAKKLARRKFRQQLKDLFKDMAKDIKDVWKHRKGK